MLNNVFNNPSVLSDVYNVAVVLSWLATFGVVAILFRIVGWAFGVVLSPFRLMK
ncbi:MAG: hypothetical protein PHO75_04525 [Candidatus Shapirobacteria bacterium]|nr:hypothetical protein [Candidatus Shapirobacteria bacterium]